MALRFRRRVTLFPGVRLNVGKRGVSVSTGIRGAHLTFGRRGVHGNVGLSGSGLSYRTKLGDLSRGGGSDGGGDGNGDAGATVRIEFAEDGRLLLRDSAGEPLSPGLLRVIRREHGDTLRDVLEQERDSRNGDIDRLLNLHCEMPAGPVAFERESFTAPRPRAPEPRPLGLLGRLLPSRRESIERENRVRQELHRRQLEAWQAARAAHGANEAAREARFRRAQACDDREAMAELLESRLAGIDWPRETDVCYEIEADRSAVLLDVALPGEEQLPGEEAQVAARGFKLNIRQKSATQRRIEYARHIHAALFRVTGEVFATLPGLEGVVVSGFVREPDPATGRERESYLLSAVVRREDWDRLDLGNLAGIDPVAAFEGFELRREMTKTAIFREVEVFGTSLAAGYG